MRTCLREFVLLLKSFMLAYGFRFLAKKCPAPSSLLRLSPL
uniref:Uncharacterized protein n=1 Tax=Arundo donax TaxID=35708 RepID=A0A0A8ZF54_ARUDO